MISKLHCCFPLFVLVFADCSGNGGSAMPAGMNAKSQFVSVSDAQSRPLGAQSRPILSSSSRFMPSQLPNNVLWLDASDASSIRSSGTAILGWNDKSGSGNSVTQQNPSSAPAYGTHQLNGLNTTTFNGTSSYLIGSNSAFSSSVFNESTIFMVTNQTTSKQTSSVVWTGAFLTDPRLSVRLTEGNVSHFDFNNKLDGRLTATDVANGPAIWTALGSVSSRRQTFSKNGTIIATDAGPSRAAYGNYPLALGATVGSGQTTDYFDGDVAEIVIYKGIISPSNVSQVEAYLACKWGLAANLPSSNPYRSGCAASSASPTAEPIGASPLPAANAAAADAFVSSIGINTHFSYTDTVYGRYLTSPAPNGNTVVSALQALGIRHVRDGSMNTAAGAYRCPIYQQVFAHGTDFDGVIPNSATTADIADMAKCLGPALFALEGPNELDNHMNFNPAFAAQDRAEMKILHDSRGSAYPASIRVFGPTTVRSESDVALHAVNGDEIAAYIDYSNGHVYFGDRNPESPGWGGNAGFGTYGALTTDMKGMDFVSPGKPYVTTETGYMDTSDGSTHLNSATKAKYVMRDVLEHWRVGAKFTYIYELAEEGGSWGLMDDRLNPRPAYTALQNLIGILKDPGGAVAVKYLRYSLAAPSNVAHILFQKRDGSFWLVLWQKDAIADPNSGAPISVAPVTAKISFATAPPALRMFAIDANTGRAGSTSLTISTAVSLNVSDTPEILQIGTSAAPLLH